MIHWNERGDIKLGARSALCTLHALIELQTPTICQQGGPRAKAEPEPPAEKFCATNIYFRNTSSAPKWEWNVNPGVQRRLGSLPRWLRLLGTKVTGPNLTRRDGNLSDTPNNLLMQKLKGLSVSPGGGQRRTGACIMELTPQTAALRPLSQRPPNHAGTQLSALCRGFFPFFFCHYDLMLRWADVFVRETGRVNNNTFRLCTVISALSPFQVRREVEDHN